MKYTVSSGRNGFIPENPAWRNGTYRWISGSALLLPGQKMYVSGAKYLQGLSPLLTSLKYRMYPAYHCAGCSGAKLSFGKNVIIILYFRTFGNSKAEPGKNIDYLISYD